MPVKSKKCKQCKELKLAANGIKTPKGWFCCMEHALEFSNEQRRKEEQRRINKKEKEDRQETKRRKKELMTRSEWLRKLQSEVNKYARIRDKREPCCTCGTTNPNIKYDAGHYIAVGRGGADPRRFELTNIHKQCSVNCNQHGSGMRAEYREFIRNKYGEEHLEWLECESNFKPLKEQFPHWTDIENEILKFRKMIKELEAPI